MDASCNDSLRTFCSNCQGKQKSELLQLVNNALREDTLITGLINAVEAGYNDKDHCNELEQLYNVLFNIYQTAYSQCQLFVLQFIPSLLCNYYLCEQKTSKMSLGRIEAVLLAVYNKEVIAQRETPFAKSFRIPSLSKSSVYHEPFNWRASLLTENALSRHEQSDKPVLMSGPSSILSRIPAGYKFQVLAIILQEYVTKISAMCEASHIAFCRLCIRIALSGYSSTGISSTSGDNLISFEELAKLESLPRIRMKSEAMKGLLHGLYFVMYNGLANYAKQALDCITVYCQTLLHVPGCMVALSLSNMVDVGSKRTEDGRSLATDAFACRRRSPDQSLPKARKGSRPPATTKETKEYVVVETISTITKREELHVTRQMTRAISDSDIRSPNPSYVVNGERTTGSKRISLTNSSADTSKTGNSIEKNAVMSGIRNSSELANESSTDHEDGNAVELKVQSNENKTFGTKVIIKVADFSSKEKLSNSKENLANSKENTGGSCISNIDDNQEPFAFDTRI